MSSDYYKQLVEQECKHIRETVTIKAYTGREAIEMTERELAQRRAETAQLKQCVKVDPVTHRATDPGFLVRVCHEIADIPRSPAALGEALYDMTQTISDRNYPAEDRAIISDALTYLVKHTRLDNCLSNQLYRFRETLSKI